LYSLLIRNSVHLFEKRLHHVLQFLVTWRCLCSALYFEAGRLFVEIVVRVVFKYCCYLIKKYTVTGSQITFNAENLYLNTDKRKYTTFRVGWDSPQRTSPVILIGSVYSTAWSRLESPSHRAFVNITRKPFCHHNHIPGILKFYTCILLRVQIRLNRQNNDVLYCF